MKVPRWLRRSRGLMLVAAGSATAAVAVAVAPGASAVQATQESPVVDAGYLYQQLYGMANGYSYRISGADGPPQDPANPFNVAPTVNGWQELMGYWKGQLTSQTSNGPVAAYATASDHYFHRTGGNRFDSLDSPAN
jgi:hypothetical protein